jgi:hypothetical protein
MHAAAAAAARHCCRCNPNPTAYGLGFFHDSSSIGFSSDAVIDIIACDTVAMLLIAAVAGATAHGPWDNGAARVYHACSAESHPESSISFFEYLHTFWSANPPPFKLPGGRWAAAGWRLGVELNAAPPLACPALSTLPLDLNSTNHRPCQVP